MAKCLVTGGAGFIGSNLVDELIRKGDEVVIIDDLSNGKLEYINGKAKFYKLDVNAKKVAEIFKEEKFDYVFHLAAQIDLRKSVEDPYADNQTNVLGSLHIFQLAAEAKIKKVIFISTGGALYGDCAKPATEETPIKLIAPYAIHKYTAEKYLDFFNETRNLKSVVLRLANVYGPRQYKGGECGVIGVYTYNVAHQERSHLFGDGSKTRDFVFVDDIVRAIIAAADNEVEGVFNIGSGKEISIVEVIAAIEKVTNKKLDYIQAENKLGEVNRSVLSYEKAKKELGWEPIVNLGDGIKKTLEWLKSNKGNI